VLTSGAVRSRRLVGIERVGLAVAATACRKAATALGFRVAPRPGLDPRATAHPLPYAAQLADWLVPESTRQHQGLGCRPADRRDADKAAMLALPPVTT
jgi:hypothetical protein